MSHSKRSFSSMSTSTSASLQPTIVLDPEERELFGIIKEVLSINNLNTTVRVAGGWVRDKILGRQNHDIDIALDDHTGNAFAQHVNKYLRENGLLTKKIAVIQANPDQSKHLETATVQICGLAIDFVNLRSETYNADSRIPKMEFGSAYEDAMRRDFTVNALFYNINTGLVEDFTGKGLSDLQAKVIRSPLPPMVTFMDDPLRVLRAVRFSSRFTFELDSELQAAMQSPEIHEALKNKVSIERIGSELSGMMSGPEPRLALERLIHFGLFPLVFQIPGDEVLVPQHGVPARLRYENTWKGGIGLKYVEVVQFLFPHEDQLTRTKSTDQDQAVAMLSAILFPFAGRQCRVKRNKEEPLIKYILSDSLRTNQKNTANVVACAETAFQFKGTIEGTFDRVNVGHIIHTSKQFWELSLALGSAAAVFAHDSPSDPATMTKVQALFNEKRKTIEAWGIENVWQTKPLLNGKQIIKALALEQPGPYVGKLMAEQKKFQILHPGLGSEECVVFLKEYHDKHADGEDTGSNK